MKIEYEEKKCVCCNKVYVNNLLISAWPGEEKEFIICFGCAKNIEKAMKDIKAND